MSSVLAVDVASPLLERLAVSVRSRTHGRIRDLCVEETEGLVTIRGHVTSHHTRQLALHAALEMLSSERLFADISVG